MRIAVVAVALGIAGALWIGVSAQQDMLPKPGPGSGITKVTGAVNISNTPDVRVVDLPPLSLASPAFARKGGSYIITWPDGGTENIIVAEVGSDGWLRADGGRRRWVNLRVAKAIEER
jgi:hypothetical protein